MNKAADKQIQPDAHIDANQMAYKTASDSKFWA